MNKVVVFHRDNDGYAAASVAYQKFGDAAEYIDVQYGEDVPARVANASAEDHIYILDFSYKREICEEIYLRAGKLTIIDHHETAATELEGLDYVTFDMKHSGNILTFKHFFPKSIPTRFHKLIEDYDLFQFKYGDETRALNLGIHSLPDDKKDIKKYLARLVRLNKMYELEEVLGRGVILLDKQKQEVNKVKYAKDGNKIVKFKDLDVVFYNAGHNINEIAEAFYTDPNTPTPVTMSYVVLSNKVIFNMRSWNKQSIVVNAIAKEMGGGGHKNAAGFVLPLVEGLALVQSLLTQE